MKAIRVHEFGAPQVMKLEEVPDPKPGAGQVAVRVHAAGVNPVDTYIRSGAYARKPALPYTPGSDGAGVVEAVGEGVKRLRVGDRVYIAGGLGGTYAGKALCLESQVQPLPQKISFAQGAGVWVPYATAYRALFQLADSKPPDVVLVHGASGGVGIAAVQLARAAGMTVIGTAGTDKGKELVRKEGAHHVLDHNAADFADKLMSLTGGRGVDVIVEMLANKNLGKDLQLVAAGGKVIIVGSRGTVEVNPRDAMMREATVKGLMLFAATERELAGIHAALFAGMENGTLRPVVGQEMPLADAPRAHEAVLAAGAYGKIVLVP
ncbi:MAG TPA: NADPH:quinone reductase [Terriglobales bacterium]|jgi:NADPH2:quinone reductase|nr:NADPH:quinone reductase [Terriglobales bacterium]